MRHVGIIGLWCVVLACSGGDGDGDGAPSTPVDAGGTELGYGCEEDSDCASGLCVHVQGAIEGVNSAFCSKPCASDAECSGEAPTCGVGHDGSSICASSCAGNHFGFGCLDGKPIACGYDDAVCSECGCPDGLRCEPGVGCGEQSDEGGACEVDDDCKSGNCSSSAKVCRMAVGSACTQDNCDVCQVSDDGTLSYCSRECIIDEQCNGGVCILNGPTGFCYQRCASLIDESCPGTCFTNSGDIACDFD